MNKEQFIIEFEENVLMVEGGTIQEDQSLDEIDEWDSMAIVATLAFLDSRYNLRVNADVLNKCKKVNDIISLVENKAEE